MRRAIHALPILALALLASTTGIQATFHFMVIDEIYPGSYAHPTAQYVVLRSTFANQNLLNTHPIMTWNAAGNPLPDFGVFTQNSPNNANGARYIMATQAAVDLFQFTATKVVTGVLPFPSGRICFAPFLSDFVDCVAYGSFAGNNGPWGTPTVAMATQKALKRTRTLVPHNNSLDYALGAPRPIDELNLVSPDDDADGIPNISDCAPTNANAYLRPVEATNLRVDRVPDGLGGFNTTLVWADQDLTAGPATVYDLIALNLSSPASPAPWSTAGCMAPNLPAAAGSDAGLDPPAGVARLYLARAGNVCGEGTYGNYNPGLAPSPPPDPRDPLDVAVTTPCP